MFARLHSMTKLVVLGVLLLSVALVMPYGASTVYAAEENPGEAVDIAGVVVLRVRVSVDGLDPLAQVSQIRQRWLQVLEEAKETLSPEMVRIEETDGVPVIYVGSVPLITVDENHARLNGTTPNGLAEVWAANLRRAIERYREIHGF